MVENPEERYPRTFSVFIVAMAAVVLGSLKFAQWFALTTTMDADSLVIVGWALGAGAVLVMNRLGRWLDEREAVVAHIERRLGGDT